MPTGPQRHAHHHAVRPHRPVADGANNDPSNPELHIVNFAIFQVSPASGGGVKYTGTFIAPAALASQGSGVFGATCQVGAAVCVARLVA